MAKTALYRIPYSLIAPYGGPPESSFYKLYHNGVEVPIYTSTNGNFTSTGHIEFFGQPNDGAFDTQLYEQPDWQLCREKSMFANTSAYYLTWDPTTVNMRYQGQVNELGPGLPPAETYFMHTGRNIMTNTHSPGVPYRALGGNQQLLRHFWPRRRFFEYQRDPHPQLDEFQHSY